MSKQIKERKEIDSRYQWDLQSMYREEKDMEEDCKAAEKLAEEFVKYSGKLGDSAEVLASAMKDKDTIWKKLEKAYVFARMKKDEDNRISQYQALCDKMHTLIAKVSAHLSFFTPELLEVPEEKLRGFMASGGDLAEYEFVFEMILREKAHVLSKAEENLMAQFSQLTPATNDIFGMINNADIKFGNVVDDDGDEVELTHGNYIRFMESHDQNVRKNAYTNMYNAYEKQRNTLATTYNYNTKNDVVFSKIRKYPSAIEGALFGDDIPLVVYDNLIQTVNENLPLLHRYVEIRKKMLGLQEVHMYDMYVPLVELPNKEIPYMEAVSMMQEGLAPLGEEYRQIMDSGIAGGWIDVYENKGKTSGAYSFGSYDSKPYILLNYNGKLKDVFTLVHEMGHSMHSYYTRKAQPFSYGGHSIFTAEVASTVNECLLMQNLLNNTENEEQKKYLLNLYIEEFRTTLFRQTMFAEFEKLTHQAVEEGTALTADYLCEEYSKLNRKYFGEKVSYDDFIKMEWSRIPHFYNAFYVYKYATGYSAAVALSKNILEKKEGALENYIEFLKSGEKDFPINLLKGAGVDMSSPDPIKKAMTTFGELLGQLEKLI